MQNMSFAVRSPRPAACSCGAIEINGCFCGTTPADWAQAERDSRESKEQAK